MFGRAKEELSMICNATIDIIYEQHGHRLRSLNQPWLRRENLEGFCEAIHQAGSPMENIWAFLDGTVRPICRPVREQRMCYNGHKRVHALKFQVRVNEDENNPLFLHKNHNSRLTDKFRIPVLQGGPEKI